MLESHPHCHDAWTDASVVRYLTADDGPACGIHNEPDKAFDAANLDVGFIGGKYGSLFVRVRVHKRFYAQGCGLAVVGNHLVRDGNAVQVLKGA